MAIVILKNIKVKLIILFASLLLISCSLNNKKAEVICPKAVFNEMRFCMVPFVEMQANYHNLDDIDIAASGVLSVYDDSVVLVDPSTNDYDLPKSYNVIEVRLNDFSRKSDEFKKIKLLHKRYVTVLGKFKARNDSKGEWPGLIAHAIEDAYVIESFP